MTSGGADSSKSAASKLSNVSAKRSLNNDGNRSLGRSSNGGNSSKERVVKLKINKSSKHSKASDKDKKIIATIQRIRQGGS
jgi:hypothetical protein